MNRIFDRPGQARGSSVLCTLLVGLAVASAPAESPAAEQTVTIASPLRLANPLATESVTQLTLDVAGYEQAQAADSFVLSGFALDARQRVDLDLHQVHILSPDARLVVGTAAGDLPLERPDLLLLSGTVVDRPDSWVFLSLTPHGRKDAMALLDELS